MTTLKDIAESTGLSQDTVSRALRGTGYVSAAARSAVEAAARRLDYRPNRAAQSLRCRKNFEITVVVFSEPGENTFDSLAMDKLAGVRSRCDESPYAMRVAFASSERRQEDAFFKSLKRHAPDGILLLNGLPHGNFLARNAGKIPVVFVAPGETPDTDCVFVGRRAGIVLGVRALYQTGRRNIVYARTAACPFREAGFHQAAAELGIEERVVSRLSPDKNYYRSGFETARILLERYPETDAVQAFSDYFAAGLCAGFAALGRRIPQDIAVCGFDGRELANYTTPPLTTLEQPNAALGRIAADLLLRRIADPAGTPEQIEVPMILKRRLSA